MRAYFETVHIHPTYHESSPFSIENCFTSNISLCQSFFDGATPFSTGWAFSSNLFIAIRSHTHFGASVFDNRFGLEAAGQKLCHGIAAISSILENLLNVAVLWTSRNKDKVVGSFLEGRRKILEKLSELLRGDCNINGVWWIACDIRGSFCARQ